MREFIVLAASNGEKFQKSGMELPAGVSMICASGAKIRHYDPKKRLIGMVRKAIERKPTKGIIVFSDILLNSLGLADFQKGKYKHEINVMSVDEVIKDLNLLTKLCGTETAVPFLVMTGNRLCEDHQDYEMGHNPDTCYSDCPRTISQNFTRGLKKKGQEGHLKF